MDSIIEEINRASLSGEYPEVESKEVFNFQWELVKKHKLPTIIATEDDFRYSPRDFMENSLFSLGEYASMVVDSQITERYTPRGAWDVYQVFEERFLSISEPKKMNKNFSFALWAASFISPKPDIFILPPEVASAIVASVINSLNFYDAQKSAVISKDLLDYWGLSIFCFGDIYRSKKYYNPLQLRNKLFFLDAEFLEKRVEF